MDADLDEIPREVELAISEDENVGGEGGSRDVDPEVASGPGQDELRTVIEDATLHRGMFGGDYVVMLLWKEDVLYVARNDYGDGDDMGDGIDILDPPSLLHWLVAARFLRNSARFAEYCDIHQVPLGRETGPTQTDSDWSVTPVTKGADPVIALRQEGRDVWESEVPEWRRLLISLVQDRCEGAGSWARVETLLEEAGIDVVPHWRGYT